MEEPKSYSGLSKLSTYEDRLNYLKLDGVVGYDTFGFDRYLNQILYHSQAWKIARNKVIIRDNGCDMGLDGYEIAGNVQIHHINPITKEDVLNRSSNLFDPENLICVSHRTHNAIHYGDTNLTPKEATERTPNDTCLWSRKE